MLSAFNNYTCHAFHKLCKTVTKLNNISDNILVDDKFCLHQNIIPFWTLSHNKNISSFPSTLPNALSTLQIFNTDELVASKKQEV